MTVSIVTRELIAGGFEDAAGKAASSSPLTGAEFHAFYDRMVRPLWLYLTRVTGNRALADDLVEETFYRFFRSGRSGNSEHQRRIRIFRIATELACGAIGADSTATSQSGLDQALGQLRPRERAMLWLAYAQGWPEADITEIVGVGPEKVAAFLVRARKQMAGMLGEK